MQRDPLSPPRQSALTPVVLPSWKRTIDIVGSLLALPLLALLSLGFAIVAAMTAKGPLFFTQEVIGYNGRRVRLYQFRTMRRKVAGVARRPVRDEPPLIPGGRFLRESGLAELPQVINVLRGELSIVGPQPVLARHFATTAAPELGALPGLMGLWRVAASTAKGGEDAAQWDAGYGARKSFGVDCRIILRTLQRSGFIVMGGRPKSEATVPRGSAAARSALSTPSRQPW